MHLGNLPAAAVALDAIIRGCDSVRAGPISRTGSLQRHQKARMRPSYTTISTSSRWRSTTGLRWRADCSRFQSRGGAVLRGLAGYRDPDLQRASVGRLGAELRRDGAAFEVSARGASDTSCQCAAPREVQLVAATNLLELAVADGREDMFEIYRRSLRDAVDQPGRCRPKWPPSSPCMRGVVRARFGRMARAAAAFERALSLAARASRPRGDDPRPTKRLPRFVAAASRWRIGFRAGRGHDDVAISRTHHSRRAPRAPAGGERRATGDRGAALAVPE